MTGITKEEAVKMFARCAEVADTDEDIVASFTNAILERAAVESERTARMHAAQTGREIQDEISHRIRALKSTQETEMSKQIEEVMALVKAHQDAWTEFLSCEEDEAPFVKLNSGAALTAIESKLRELLPVWQPIDTAPVKRDVLAVNSLGYIGRAYQDSSGRWNHIGKPIGWMPLPKAPE